MEETAVDMSVKSRDREKEVVEKEEEKELVMSSQSGFERLWLCGD